MSVKSNQGELHGARDQADQIWKPQSEVRVISSTAIRPPRFWQKKAKRPNIFWDAWYIWGVSGFYVGTRNQDVKRP